MSRMKTAVQTIRTLCIRTVAVFIPQILNTSVGFIKKKKLEEKDTINKKRDKTERVVKATSFNLFHAQASRNSQ